MNRAFAALTLSILALAGCSFDPAADAPPPGEPGTPGTEGHVHFSYAPFVGCPSDDCSSMKPMMVGTSEFIALGEYVLPADLVVTAEDPAVLGVSFEASELCCSDFPDDNAGGCLVIDVGAACTGTRTQSYDITVDALSAGQTRLLLEHPDGSLFDALPLRVEAPAALTLSCEQSGGSAVEVLGSLSLSSSAPCALRTEALDAAGAPLQATSGFVIATADTNIARVDARFFTANPPGAVFVAEATLAAVSPGATELTVSAGSLTTTINVDVK